MGWGMIVERVELSMDWGNKSSSASRYRVLKVEEGKGRMVNDDDAPYSRCAQSSPLAYPRLLVRER